jgi:hypothetical protein
VDLGPDNLDALCRESEALCRRVAPLDLGDRPLYVLPQSALPAELAVSESCGGYTAERADLQLRPYLGDRWAGRGPLLVVNDLALRGAPPDMQPHCWDGIVLHELAHVLAEGWTGQADDPEADAVEIRAKALAMAASLRDTEAIRPALCPWRWHELHFLRAAAHVLHRARQLGAACWAEHMVPDIYRVGPFFLYLREAAAEAAALADRAIGSILATPPPSGLRTLWEEAIADFLNPKPRPWEAGSLARPPATL